MYALIVILIILVEILVASWLIYFFTRLDKAVVLIDKNITEHKSEIFNVLSEYRLKLRELNEQTLKLKEKDNIKKALGVIQLTSFFLLLKNKFM